MVCAMSRTSTYPLVDRILGGTLGALLRTRRSEGASFDGIARELENKHRVRVSADTVRRWCADEGLL